MADFEARYLDISWKSPDTVKKLIASNDAIELIDDADGYSVDTVTFPKSFKYVGIRFIVDKKVQPSTLLADGSRKPLTPLKEPGSENIWWVQLDDWTSSQDKSGGYYYSSLYRTAGKSRVKLSDEVLTINNHTVNFSADELEYFLKDFKNDLWLLILDQSSSLTSTIESKGSNLFELSNLEYLADFIDSVEKILKKPTIELIEQSGKVSRRRVRPLPATFRETISQPHARQLTSRVCVESYDTNENRYVAYCITRMRYLLKNMHNVVISQRNLYKRRLEQEEARLEELSTQKTKKVDRRVLQGEINTLKGQLSNIQFRLGRSNRLLEQALVIDPSDTFQYESFDLVHRSYELNIGKTYSNRNNCFFVNHIDGRDIKHESGAKYVIVLLPLSLNLDGASETIAKSKILISGLCERKKVGLETDKFYYQITFYRVESIKLCSQAEEKLSAEIIRLERQEKALALQNWVIPLDKQEVLDIQKECEILKKRCEGFDDLYERTSNWLKPLPVLEQRLNKLFRFFNKHTSKMVTVCPNTMTFVQNPHYAKAKASYKHFKDNSGVTDSFLDEMLKIDEIGLVNVANLYERWCLLQILKVLSQTYGFKLESEWKSKLLRAVSPNNYDIELNMECEERQQRIMLTYEKQLENGKRPDFVIDFFCPEYVEPPNSNSLWTTRGEEKYRLVLDAKFRGEETENTLVAIVNDLRLNKDYSEGDRNPLFIIHPVKKAIDNPTSPLEWGENCDYGQTNDHKYGSIFLSPSIDSYRSAEHLQRLLGLFLQPKGVILSNPWNTSNVTWHNMICIGCGQPMVEKYSQTKRGKPRWELTCSACSLLTIKTVCRKCSKPLFKNGLKWTYHRTRATQTSNVVCPSCEEFL